MPDSVSEKEKREIAKVVYRTDERDILHNLAKKYKCSPFNGECYIDTVSLYKIKKLYHIILTEDQMNEFGQDFIVEEDTGRHGEQKHRFLLMIKPISEDNNYIFFRRK